MKLVASHHNGQALWPFTGVVFILSLSRFVFWIHLTSKKVVKQGNVVLMLQKHIFFFFFLRFYLFIHREREAESQAEGEAGSMQGAQHGT